MPGLGTLINVVLIIVGGLIGLAASSLVTERLQDALLRACGACIVFVGIAGTLQHMLVATVTEDGTVRLSTTGTMMLVVSMALGTVIGEVINIDARFDDLGKWLRDDDVHGQGLHLLRALGWRFPGTRHGTHHAHRPSPV